MLSRAALGTLVLSLAILVPLAGRAGQTKAGKDDLPKELAPRTFTMSEKDVALAKVLAELTKQTGNRVEDRRRGKEDTKINVDLKNVTFWQAIDAIAKSADARVSVFERDAKLALVDGPYVALPTCYSGLFRVCVKRIDTSHLLDTDGHNCVIYLEIAWEPRFQPLMMETRPDSLVLQDDKGRAIEVGDEEGKGMASVGRRLATDLQVRVPAPQRNANRLGVFKGKLAAVGPTRMITFTFDKLAKIEKKENARKETQDGVSVTLRELRAEEEGEEQIWAAGLVLEYPADGPKFESFQSFVINNEIHLEKEKDGIKQMFPPNLGYETSGTDQSDNRAVVRYRFGDEQEKKLVIGNIADWKLVYRTPGKIAEVPIPFEFKDIPLP